MIKSDSVEKQDAERAWVALVFLERLASNEGLDEGILEEK
jgi:hypothetical protein